MDRLAGKTALITGGGSGIGASTAKLFVAEGARVVITGRRENVLRDFSAQFPEGAVSYVVGDITNYDDAGRMVDETVRFGGSLDVLVNNAGIDPAGLAHEIPLETWDAVISTNINGTFYMIRHALPQMMKQGKGSIINVSSLAGLMNIPAMTAYSTTKAGMIGMSKSIALDYGKYGIRSNVIAPGATATDMLIHSMGEGGIGESAEEALQILTRFLPLARPASPDEIAAAVLFFASDESGYVTGQTLAVEGGATIVDPCGVATRDFGKSSWGEG
ncbi:MAG: SDR family oxidoreductase [Clostridiales Family XIII bacterium]|jgi:NAD(P)-dependent dehydrogenase (short-subunit alcohol dehydrogenase family)|nr:SDR family oxidoreductase [Clostridiales Family XIII bacterium]